MVNKLKNAMAMEDGVNNLERDSLAFNKLI